MKAKSQGREKRAPDYRGRTYVQPDGTTPKKGTTPYFKRKGAKKQ